MNLVILAHKKENSKGQIKPQKIPAHKKWYLQD